MTPLISDYIDALASPEGRFSTLENVEPMRDTRGEIRFLTGGNAVVFPLRGGRMLKCYTREPQYARTVCEAVKNDALVAPCRYLESEIFVHDFGGEGDFCDIVTGDWVDGVTLETAARRAVREGGIAELSEKFDRFATELLSRPWAHGDLKPENIMVKNNGRMCLVDVDAMWLPEFEGLSTAELGTPGYSHPARTEKYFCKAIDDYPIALISASLRALVLDRSLWRDENLVARERVAELFIRHRQYHSYRLWKALDTPVPEIPSLLEMLGATAEEARENLDIRAACDGYDRIKPFSEGLAAVLKDGLWGFISRDGTEIVPPRFELAGSMHQGRALVKTGGKYGYIDASGEVVIAPEWDYAMSFRNGRATVVRGNDHFEIDYSGRVCQRRFLCSDLV